MTADGFTLPPDDEKPAPDPGATPPPPEPSEDLRRTLPLGARPRGADETGPRRERGRAAAKKRGRWWVFLLANAIPIGLGIGWFALPQETRDRIWNGLPTGVGARATAAAVAFVVLVVLARVVLPAAHVSIGALSRAMAWFRARRGAARFALYPAEIGTGFLWFVAQAAFAIDAALVLLAALAFLGYVARIVRPEWFTFLPG
jgi:hypothetical protein